MTKKILATVIFVLVVVLLGMVLWQLVASILNVSLKSGSLLPVSPQSIPPVSSGNFFGNPPVIEKKYLGELSPLYGKITISISESRPGQSAVENEYLYLIANTNNKKPIKISGMMLQSLVSGNAAIIPQGAETYILGQINATEDIYLAPGQAAIVHSGTSPVNYSFRTNICSGYLNEWLDFKPPLSTLWCPRPESVVPNTVSNLKKYGDACMDAIRSLTRCEHFTSENKYYNKVSKACRNKLKLDLTYNACVGKYKNTKAFHHPGSTWYVYLGRNSSLWKEKYEAIKLIDEEGRTVAAISF